MDDEFVYKWEFQSKNDTLSYVLLLVLGKTSQLNEPNVVDVLGHLLITTKIGGALFFYILITLALRLKRKESATIK
jgi:hypothetical protein